MKAYLWLAQTEKMLQAGCGIKDWGHFQIVRPGEDEYPSSPSSWPSCTVHVDQGLDGWAAGNFLMPHFRCNVMILKDPAHRCWNDVQLAFEDSNNWAFMLGMIAVFSCDHGPWAENRFYTEAAEAAHQYCKVASPGCAILADLYPKILADQGLAFDGFESTEQEVSQSLQVAYRAKLPKVATSRWFQIFDCLGVLDQAFSKQKDTLTLQAQAIYNTKLEQQMLHRNMWGECGDSAWLSYLYGVCK